MEQNLLQSYVNSRGDFKNLVVSFVKPCGPQGTAAHRLVTTGLLCRFQHYPTTNGSSYV
jgi:hypothetical protein